MREIIQCKQIERFIYLYLPNNYMKNKQKRLIDVKVWRAGHSLVVTIPQNLAEKFNLKEGDLLEVTISK